MIFETGVMGLGPPKVIIPALNVPRFTSQVYFMICKAS
jgi:hypothetical protein